MAQEQSFLARRELEKIDILAFDDLFAEKISDRAESLLLSVLDTRLRNEKPTLITTMFTGSTVKFHNQERGAAVLRRLRETCAVVQFGK